MTQEERETRVWIETNLQEEGHVSYAKLVSRLDLALVDNDEDIGYFVFDELRYVLNRNLSEKAALLVSRHESLHWFLMHLDRARQYWVSKFPGISEEEVDIKINNTFEQINVAADFEICNLTYDDDDKWTVRTFSVKGKKHGGLVTEDYNGLWVSLSFEEMYELLLRDAGNSDGTKNIAGNKYGSGNFWGNVLNSRKNCRVEGDDTRLSDIKQMLMCSKDVLQDLQYKLKDRVRVYNTKKENERYQKNISGIIGFKNEISDFLKNTLGAKRGYSWNRFNNKALESGYFAKGRHTQFYFSIPTINVYFDRSGSFDEKKTAIVKSAIAILQEYEKRRKLKLNLKYFAETVSDNDDGSCGTGTNGTPILEDIIATRPDNVIILTDDNINDCVNKVVVPGFVWIAFASGTSQNIYDAIDGYCGKRCFFLE